MVLKETGAILKILPPHIHIKGRGNYQVDVFYSDMYEVSELYPERDKHIDYWKNGPKLYMENVDVCRGIIQKLDRNDDRKHGRG